MSAVLKRRRRVCASERYFIPAWLWAHEKPAQTPHGPGWLATVVSVEAGNAYDGAASVTFVCGEDEMEAVMLAAAFEQHCTRLDSCLAAPPEPKRTPSSVLGDTPSITSTRRVRGATNKELDDLSDPLMKAQLSIYWPGDRRHYEVKVIERRMVLGAGDIAFAEHRVEYTEPDVHYHWHDLREFEYTVVGRGSERAQPQPAVSQTPSASSSRASAVEPNHATKPPRPIKRVRKLRFVEWFAGSGRLSFALMASGWEGVIHDYDPDAVEWELHGVTRSAENYRQEEFLSIDRSLLATYDYFHFSIDCSSFSGLARGANRRNLQNDFYGETPASAHGNRLLARSLDMITDQLDRNPFFLYTMENPVGDMQKHPQITSRLELPRKDGGLGASRCCVNYCLFGHNRSGSVFHKPTVFWTNCKAIVRTFGTDQDVPGAPSPQFLCSPDSPCGLKHKAVQGNTKEATPFPHRLATMLALLINAEASSARVHAIG
jgi:hypothetical protein